MNPGHMLAKAAPSGTKTKGASPHASMGLPGTLGVLMLWGAQAEDARKRRPVKGSGP